MKKLIIHIGPAKCGSSTIQAFFINNKVSRRKVKFKILDPSDIDLLNNDTSNDAIVLAFLNGIKKEANFSHTLILSNEYLFQCPIAISKISNYFVKRVKDVRIIGYCRRQSDFLVSAYSQWFFRSKERVLETRKTLIEADINPIYFLGVEQFLIASILNNFLREGKAYNPIYFWAEHYSKIEDLCKEAQIICNTLPSKDSKKNLITDFSEKVEIHIKNSLKAKTDLIENTSFSPDLIESINILLGSGIELIGLDEKNNFLIKASKAFTLKKLESPFLSKLLLYIDSYFYKQNIELSKKFGLQREYFSVNKNINFHELLDIIKTENKRRLKEVNILNEREKLINKLVKAMISI